MLKDDHKKITLADTEPSDWNGDRDQILDLYARRLSISYIAQAIGRSNGFVSKVLHSEFQERNGRRQAIVEAHAQTLNWMIQKVTKRISEAKGLWDRRDAEHLLKLLEREARLFGLDQPTQHQVQVSVEQLSEEELLAELNRAGYQITQPNPPAQLPPPAESVEDARIESPDTSDL